MAFQRPRYDDHFAHFADEYYSIAFVVSRTFLSLYYQAKLIMVQRTKVYCLNVTVTYS